MNISKIYSPPLSKPSSSSPGVHHAWYHRMLPWSGPGPRVLLQKRCGVAWKLFLPRLHLWYTLHQQWLFPNHDAFHHIRYRPRFGFWVPTAHEESAHLCLLCPQGKHRWMYKNPTKRLCLFTSILAFCLFARMRSWSSTLETRILRILPRVVLWRCPRPRTGTLSSPHRRVGGSSVSWEMYVNLSERKQRWWSWWYRHLFICIY